MDLTGLLEAFDHDPLHEILRRIRQQAGISQRLLADRCGVKPSVVCRLEKGADARLSTWIRVFEGLGCHLKVWQVSTEELLDMWPDHVRRKDNQLKGLEENWQRIRKR